MSSSSSSSQPSSSSSSSSSSSPPPLLALKMLLVSHIVTFGVGVYMGKRMDAEELESYRRVHHVATETKWKKRFTIAAGVLTVIGLATTTTMSFGPTRKPTS
mmetsp:Transcript_14253/g.22267  ORF Transcript_14253/g.22267 Transcript_14253/m.22267 type:complete len:102 (-) Transcript_14253:122-427(-)